MRSDDDICQECGSPLMHVQGDPNPRSAQIAFRGEPCGHHLMHHEALAAATANVPMTVVQVNGGTLASAERRRQIVEEGHTAEGDARLEPGQLAWAAWAILDRVDAPQSDAPPPTAWPFPASRWPTAKSPLRLLIIAAALIIAEIDRRLAAGEKP